MVLYHHFTFRNRDIIIELTFPPFFFVSLIVTDTFLGEAYYGEIHILECWMVDYWMLSSAVFKPEREWESILEPLFGFRPHFW